jgi:hypothetical protein
MVSRDGWINVRNTFNAPGCLFHDLRHLQHYFASDYQNKLSNESTERLSFLYLRAQEVQPVA